MNRKTLIVASAGGVAALALVGSAIGVAAAEERTGRTTLAAATTAPAAPTTTPDDSAAVPTSPGATDAPTTAAPTSAAPSATGSPSGGVGPAAGDAAVDLQRAGEIALARVGGGEIVGIEAEREDGRDVWSVEIVDGQTEHEIDVDRKDGAVVKAEQEPVDDDDDDDDDGDDDGDDD
ncbi:PepSY domain-containing protein [Micromonospora sp. WMMD882]|uniref:PepSY domain-containing protein n=1 Tax=Micromonospora sp. WMMD882 TaxID=3015151 RepID=UPI00248C8F56|nr:PepSY domain-containing protein [Micromonospora sp. WMMD882]WBB78764.1 PepSY domain-containing protein [Micromonospora sp. WMMD882]